MLRAARLRPIETIIIAMRLMPRFRSGRQSPRSSSAPVAAPMAMAIAAAGIEVDPVVDVDEPGDHRAPGHQLAVGEVDEPGRAEDRATGRWRRWR